MKKTNNFVQYFYPLTPSLSFSLPNHVSLSFYSFTLSSKISFFCATSIAAIYLFNPITRFF